VELRTKTSKTWNVLPINAQRHPRCNFVESQLDISASFRGDFDFPGLAPNDELQSFTQFIGTAAL